MPVCSMNRSVYQLGKSRSPNSRFRRKTASAFVLIPSNVGHLVKNTAFVDDVEG